MNFGASQTLTDAEIIFQVQNHFQYMHPDQVLFHVAWQDLLNDYRDQRAAGKNDGAILNLWVSEGSTDRQTAADFIGGMKLINAGSTIPSPTEAPSMGEIVSGYSAKIPWKTILLVGLAYAFVTQGLPRLLKK